MGDAEAGSLGAESRGLQTRSGERLTCQLVVTWLVFQLKFLKEACLREVSFLVTLTFPTFEKILEKSKSMLRKSAVCANG